MPKPRKSPEGEPPKKPTGPAERKTGKKSAKKGPGRPRPPLDYAQAAIEAFRVNERLNQHLLEHLDPRVWTLDPPNSKGRTIAAIVSHIHNVRHMWLVVSAKDLKVPPKVDRSTLTLEQARSALKASALAMCELLKRGVKSGGYIKNFSGDILGFLSYAMGHEFHHRGQICMQAKLLGAPLAQKAGYGLWEWKKRALECEPLPLPTRD